MNKLTKIFLTIIALPLFAFLSGCDSSGAFSEANTEPSEPSIKLERIDIVPSPVTTQGLSKLTIAKGNTQPFIAIGHYSDNSSHELTDLNLENWQTSTPSIGHFVEPGVFLGAEMGSTTITATKNDITSNSLEIDVSTAIITGIQITPSSVKIAKGQTEKLIVTAIYTDGSSADVTDSVKWQPLDTKTATITQAGLLTGIDVGNTTLTATIINSNDQTITSNTVNVTVSPAVITHIQLTPSIIEVAKGQKEQLTVTAIYSDGSTSDVTGSVKWQPLNTGTVTITQAGLLTGVDVGTTTLTAIITNTNDQTITSNTADITVSKATITDIEVSPSPVSVAKNQTEQLTATATYTDGSSSDVTSSVTWKPLDTAIAIVTPTGLLTGVEMGSTTLTAMLTNSDAVTITSNKVDVAVTAAVITDIEVTPLSVDLIKNETTQLTATATFSDGSSLDVTNSVTWQSLNTETATVTSSGLLTAVEAGSTIVTATKDHITSNMVDVTVSLAIMTDLKVLPSTVYIEQGKTWQLTATATFSDGSTLDVTDSVTWQSLDTETATISSTGLLTGIKVGSTTTANAIKDSMTSNTVNVESVCEDLTGVCIDLLDTDGGQLFTSSPSVAFFDAIGGNSDNTFGIYIGQDRDSPVGEFYRLSIPDSELLCSLYNDISLGGRTNWRLPTFDELRDELFYRYVDKEDLENLMYGTFFRQHAWPTTISYWSSDSFGVSIVKNKSINFYTGSEGDVGRNYGFYTTCMSEP